MVIGIGKQSRTYIPASKHVTVSKIAARKRLPINVTTTHSPPGYKVPRKNKIKKNFGVWGLGFRL